MPLIILIKVLHKLLTVIIIIISLLTAYTVKRKGIINRNVLLYKVNMILIIDLKLVTRVSWVLPQMILVTSWVLLSNCHLHLACQIIIVVICNKNKLICNLPYKQIYLAVVTLLMIFVIQWLIMLNKPGKKVKSFLQNRSYLLNLWNYRYNSLMHNKLKLVRY